VPYPYRVERAAHEADRRVVRENLIAPCDVDQLDIGKMLATSWVFVPARWI